MSAPSRPTQAPSYLATSTGLKSWLCTDDHKRVAVIYLLGIASATLVGGLLAIILRLEALASGSTLVDSVTHSRLFTMHGLVMVFAVVIPAIPAVLGNFILPLQIGAPGLALPRLNRLALYLWMAGTLLLLAGFALGGADTGWTLSAPYSIETPTFVLPVLLALALLAASALLTAINFLVTIHYLRTAGLGWMQLPLSVWSLYVFAVVQLVTAPVLIAAMLLLFAERTLGTGYFDPTLGGDPTLFSRLFWFYAHPATFASVVTAAGVVSEILTTFARRPLVAYRYLVGAIIALGGLGLVSWGRNLVIPGQTRLSAMIFSALALAIAIPATLLVCNWLATLYRGSVRLSAPMLYALAFVVLFVVAIATGLLLSALATAEPLHNTLLASAHFHYLMVGGTMVGFVAGLHYWWPKIFGRTYAESRARVGAVLVFIALNLTLIPQLIMGARGTLRHAFDYDPAIESLQMISTVGGLVLAAASSFAVLNLALSAFKGSPAPANPWGGTTLEWETRSPPPLANFPRPPEPHPLHDYDLVSAGDDGYHRQQPDHD
jgi:cytochrome c oxidase subunit 1